ncbi:hypothetical protein HOF92_10620 [bacterium]|jgi:hypothetical protein|nr:hypothetical protein [bacterium]
MNHDMYLLDQLNELIKTVGKQKRVSNVPKVRTLLKKNFHLSDEEMNHLTELLKSREIQPELGPDSQELRKINAYLDILEIRPRNFDSQNPDLKKLKILVANRKMKVKRSSTE